MSEIAATDAEVMRPELRLTRSGVDSATIEIEGSWSLATGIPSLAEIVRQLAAGPAVKTVKIDAKQLTAWDSGLLTFLVGLERHCRDKGISLVRDGLPAGVQRLLTLALAVPERKDARRSAERKGLLTSVGERVIALGKGSLSTLAFVGEAMIALGRFARGRARFRGSDLVLTLQQCGAQAFPIVSLISFLVGLILAFVGAVQLRQFGAQIYVADLVGIAMVREMGAIMTGIVMAGRTGAAFAAQLGTMQVNEEIDALTTLGLSPMEFLVLPRMLALALMMPLLCVYADLMGMVGGLLIGVGMLDLGFLQYVQQTREAISLTNVSIGLAKASIFGVLVAVSGCLHGIRSGRSASAVGSAATSAVVTGIVAIIVCDAIFAVILEVIGI